MTTYLATAKLVNSQNSLKGQGNGRLQAFPTCTFWKAKMNWFTHEEGSLKVSQEINKKQSTISINNIYLEKKTAVWENSFALQ